MEISEIDGRLAEEYERKMEESLAVSIFFKGWWHLVAFIDHYTKVYTSKEGSLEAPWLAVLDIQISNPLWWF